MNDGPGQRDAPQRSWLEIRWRQARNPPPPVFRAVASNLIVAAVGGTALLAYDIALSSGARLPGGDQRTLAFVAFLLTVMVSGSLFTYLWVRLPGTTSRRRSPWSAMLGFFASLPVAYLVLVVCFQVLRPLLIRT
jgi:hypothetical protein